MVIILLLLVKYRWSDQMRMRWVGHAACTGEKRIHRHIGEDCVKMDLELWTGLICNVEFLLCIFSIRFTRWHSRLRRCTTSQNVAGWIPDSVTGTYHWHNPSCHAMAFGSNQSLTEMSNRRPVRRADNLTTFMCQLSWNLGASTSCNPEGLSCFTSIFLINCLSNFSLRVHNCS